MPALVGVFGGPFTAADLTPLTGTVIFRPSTSAPLDAGIVTTATVTAALDGAGSFTAQLVDSDDPDWSTECPMYYTVEVRVDGLWDKFTAYIPGPGPHDLADLIHLDAPPHVATVATPGPPGPPGPPGTTDHGALTGLGDDDHPQYLTDTRGDVRYPQKVHTHTQAQSHLSPDTDTAPTALHHTLGAGANQAAAGTHTHTAAAVGAEPAGSVAAHDASTTAHAALRGSTTPAAANADPPATGSAAKFARDDHKHQVTTGTPVALGPANAPGSATGLARADHVHIYPTAGNVGAEPAGAMAAHLAAPDPHPQYGAGGGGGLDQATADARYVNVAGDTLTGGLTISSSSGLSMAGNQIFNVGNPVNDTDAANKAYADSRPGPEGPAGPPGGAYLSAQWTFNQTTTPPPVSGGLRLNATTFTAATSLFISETDRDGLDRNAGLNVAKVGDQIMVQSAQGRAVFNVTTLTDSGTYRTFGVTLAESSGTRPSASAITTVYVITATPPGHVIQDEGTTLATRTKVNYVGAGVTATDDAANDRTLVTIPGASGGSTILSGTATPTGATGAVGDYYLDSDDRILYGPKVNVSPQEYVTPTPLTTNGGGNVTAGMKVRFAVPGYVHGVRLFLHAAAAATTGYEVYLFNKATTALMASKDAPTLTVNSWNTVLFDAPVPVLAATTYTVAAWYPTGLTMAREAGGTGAFTGLVSGNVTMLADGVDGGEAAMYNATRDTLPNTDIVASHIGVSPIFSLDIGPWPVALKSIPPGGTTGQYLKKTSNADYAVAWVT